MCKSNTTLLWCSFSFIITCVQVKTSDYKCTYTTNENGMSSNTMTFGYVKDQYINTITPKSYDMPMRTHRSYIFIEIVLLTYAPNRNIEMVLALAKPMP